MVAGRLIAPVLQSLMSGATDRAPAYCILNGKNRIRFGFIAPLKAEGFPFQENAEIIEIVLLEPPGDSERSC